MEDSFQFIIESPQHNQGHKKRPRLVTSCDNCRLKKIKCLQPSPETKCEACKAAKIQCRFRDRERYFAERSRAIAGPSAASTNFGDDQRRNRTERTSSLDAFSVASSSSSPAMSSHSNPRSNSHSPKAGGMVSPDVESNGRYHSYSPDPRHPPDSHRHAGSSSIYTPRSTDPVGYGYSNNGSALPPHHARLPAYQPQSRHVHLFDPDQPHCPHPVLMPQFLQTFFERFGPEFSFLVYEDIMQDFWDRVLPPILQNCIAAMASRYSTLPELTVRGLHNVAETYADNAKTILSSIGHIPSMETLHAIMLLSWSEYKNNRVSAFRSYYQMAMRMAVDLGLSEQPTSHQPHLSDKERTRRRATWANVLQMHMTASSYDR